MSSTAELLAGVPLFGRLAPDDLERLASATRTATFEPGDDIVEIGEPGRSLYVLTRGRVQVIYPSRNSEVELARLGPGDFFGEMALLNEKPRSATVRALEPVEAVVLDKEDFRTLLLQRPEVAVKLLEILSVRIRQADEKISGFSEQAVRDALTHLLNRRAFNERIAGECDRTRRYGSGFALILLDLDHFKAINDTLGHDSGDEILAWVGRLLTEHTRSADVPFRLGGEEFAVICPSTPPEVARSVAQRLVDVIHEAQPPVDPELHISASAGYATCPEDGATPEELYGAADRALYAAKQEGRNRVAGPA